MKLEDLPNLGPASASMLRKAGIDSESDLRELGAVAAYLRVRAVDGKTSLNLLYALEGAITGHHWAKLPDGSREALLMAVDAADDLA